MQQEEKLTERQEMQLRSLLLKEVRDILDKASEVVKLDHELKEVAVRNKADDVYYEIIRLL